MSLGEESGATENSPMSPVTKVAIPLEVELARVKEGLYRLYDPLLKKGVLEGNYTPWRFLLLAEQALVFLETSLEEDQLRSAGLPVGSPSSSGDESGKG